MYTVENCTGAILVDASGRGYAPERAGRVVSRHRLLRRAQASAAGVTGPVAIYCGDTLVWWRK